MPAPETPILDDEAVGKIESAANEGFKIDAAIALDLCATVKQLRADAKSKKIELLQLSGRGDLLTKVHVKFDDLDSVAAVRNEFDRLRNIVIVELQSQLEQLRAENERLRANWANRSEDLATGLLRYEELQTRLAQVESDRDELSKVIEACHALLDEVDSEHEEGTTSFDPLDARLRRELFSDDRITDADVNGDD